MGTYYRMQRPEDDPERLLDPDEQYTEPWGDTHKVRDGVSVFPELDDLYRYMVRNGADIELGTQVVCVEGEPSEDRDFDADEGAVLVNPTRIVRIDPVDRDRLEELRTEAR